MMHEDRQHRASQLLPAVAAASPKNISAAAEELAAACAETCRRPVLLHALAQLRRQSIFPVHHAGVVAVRTVTEYPVHLPCVPSAFTRCTALHSTLAEQAVLSSFRS